MDNQKLIIETIKESQVLNRKRILLNGKSQKTPFYIPLPHNPLEMDLICEISNPADLLLEESDEEKDFIGAILFKLFEHDDILRDKEHQLNQLNLFTNKTIEQGYRYIKQTKFKLIEPGTELFRLRSIPLINKYLKINKIPNYLTEYLKILKDADRDNLEETHNEFWKKVFSEKRTAHLIQWVIKQQKDRGADIFIPPVPYISYKSRDDLLNKAIEINSDSLELVGETSATYFSIDVQIFRYRDCVEKLLDYLSYINTRFNLFKIINADSIIAQGFGQDARKNFEFFLKVIKSIKEENPQRIFGLLNGGGFGYCLIGAGFDFFVDTVNNYQENFIRPSKKRAKFRKILNEETFSLEPFEGAMNMLKDNGTLIGNNSIIKKYQGKNKASINSHEWSEDCKRHGILTWNKLTKVAVRGINENEDSLYFDKVINSDYAILGNILRNI